MDKNEIQSLLTLENSCAAPYQKAELTVRTDFLGQIPRAACPKKVQIELRHGEI